MLMSGDQDRQEDEQDRQESSYSFLKQPSPFKSKLPEKGFKEVQDRRARVWAWVGGGCGCLVIIVLVIIVWVIKDLHEGFQAF